MKPKPGARRVMTATDVAARVSALAPRFLDGLARGEVAEILRAAHLRRLRAHTVVAREGHGADHVYLLLEGQARYFTTTREGDKIVLLRLLPGELSGGNAIVSSRPLNYLVSTEAVVDSSVLVWARSAILVLARRYPRLVENTMWISSDYLAHYRDLHLALSREKADKRVAGVLERLTRQIGQKVPGGVEVRIRNEELANEANVTIFTVSRLLSEWHRKGFLVKSRGRVVVRSLEGLVRSAG